MTTTPSRQSALELRRRELGDESIEGAEAIAALAPLPMPAGFHAIVALLDLGPEAAPALKYSLLAYGDNAHMVLWAALEEGIDCSAGLSA